MLDGTNIAHELRRAWPGTEPTTSCMRSKRLNHPADKVLEIKKVVSRSPFLPPFGVPFGPFVSSSILVPYKGILRTTPGPEKYASFFDIIGISATLV